MSNLNPSSSSYSSPSNSSSQKKMYKVICPFERKGGGGSYWLRVGTAFTNRDDSIKLIIDAIPAPNPNNANRYELHIRELDAEDLRKRDSYSSGGNARGHSNNNDLGGIGGGPSSRAATSSHASDDVAF